MASKKVYIDVIVDDKGTTKRVAVDAKALGDQLDKSGASTDRATKSQDRLRESTGRANKQTRALAGTTSSFGKTMGNLASGIQGGLVPAYATLAANIFAITALFDALSRAADFTKLIAGQEALAANTGIAYKTMSNSIKEATGAQISYKDAASAAAIGGAAGLSAEQLSRLGKAAKDTSLVLGRDLTDSFNRLVRGVTKAEPELLDELGIVLRLEPATLKYANSIGKSVKELSAYERSQAVANEVLEQAERKFGNAAAGADRSGESIQRLKSSFDSMLETVQSFLIKGLAPIFDFLANNTSSLVAAMTILGSGIVTALTPAAPALAKMSDAAGVAEGSIRKLALGSSKLGKALSDKNSKLIARDFDQLEKSANAATSTVINMSGQNKKEVLKNIRLMRLQHNIELAKMEGGWKKYYLSAKANISATLVESGKLVGGFKLIARGASLLLRALPFVGIGLMLFDVVKMLGIGTKELSEAEEKAAESTRNFTERTKLLNDELESTNKTLKSNKLSLTEAAIAVGNMSQSAGLSRLIQDFSQLAEGTEAFAAAQKEILRTFDILGDSVPEFKTLKQDFIDGKAGTEEFDDGLHELTNTLVTASKALERYQEAVDAVANSQRALASGIKVTPLATLVDDLTGRIQKFNDASPGIAASLAQAEAALTAARNKRAENEEDVNKRLEEAAQASGAAQLRLLEAQEKAESRTNIKRGRTPEFLQDAQAASKEAQLSLKAIQDEKKAYDDAVDAAESALSKRQEEQELRIAEGEKNIAQQVKFGGLQEKISANIRKQLSLEEEQANTRTKGVTLSERLENIGVAALADTQKILEAENALFTARAQQAALTDEASTAEKNAAQAAVDAARVGLVVAERNRDVNAENREIQRETTQFQRTLNELKNKELIATRAINSARAGLSRLEANLGESFGFAAARSIAVAREDVARQALRGATAQQNTAQSRFDQAQTMFDNEQIDENQLLMARQQLDQATSRTAQAKLQLDIAKGLETSLKNQMLAETEGLQLGLKLQSLHPAQEAYNKRILDYKNRGALLDVETLAFIEEETLKQEQLTQQLELKKSLQDSISSNFTQAFENIADGSMNAKQAFSQMAKSMLADLAQLITRAFILNTLLPSLTGGLKTETSTGGFNKLRSGDGPTQIPLGDPNKRYGGIVEPYAMGGIARGRDAGYPAILHGTEAVVPLPNGREIPVEMVGGASGTNNVSVNISMDNQGGAQQQNTADNNQMRDLGLAISGAVQEELQKQKRPGGILSPYGAA